MKELSTTQVLTLKVSNVPQAVPRLLSTLLQKACQVFPAHRHLFPVLLLPSSPDPLKLKL